MDQRPLEDRVSAVTALDDPVRRALFALVSRSEEPVSRDAAATELGLSRSTAAFHLDRLADQGLLAVEFRRLSGRTGPGSGRPSKLYRRAPGEVEVSVPERHYELAGELLAAAVEDSVQAGASTQDALFRRAFEAGRELGARVGSFDAVLEEHGFEPRRTQGDDVVLGNCPFHHLARRHPEVVCGLNLALLRGVAEGAGEARRTLLLDPGAGRCCVRATTADVATDQG